MTHEHDNPWNTEATVALFMAVLYHGLSSLAAKAVPARTDTVVATAERFQRHLAATRR